MAIYCKCPKCGSNLTRSIDNQPLYHPTKEDVANDVSRVDTELYYTMECDVCLYQFVMIGDVKLRPYNAKYQIPKVSDMVKDLILVRIQEIKEGERGFSKDTMRWASFKVGVEHLSEVDFNSLSHEDLVKVYERIVVRLSKQM